ncbi:uncharacterized protein LOC130743944 [Lotus japonicus]|uniref:uncharacterized protein LOC130743944 n=1 Tax=Lotus japonicus TaxID=34305 RepID=UPI002586256C|nr:uncharacterized protein LOC130743944 [Lotus japonicus]
MDVEHDTGGGPPAGKPPEPTRRPTFKEKVLGKETIEKRKQVQNLVDVGIMKKDFIDGNSYFPMFDFKENSVYDEICKPWVNCLVVKLLGKHIGYKALCERLRMLWKPAGGVEVRDLHHGYFLVQFDVLEDTERAMTGAPWMIYDHYLAVKPWTPDFVAANSEISTTAVWIRIPGLGFQFYDESILVTLASAVGTPIRVDMNTVDMQRGKYARVCVEIDLNKPVLGRVGLRGVWYNIEYEGLHLLCSNCGCYGHLARQCTGTPVPQPQTRTQTATTVSPTATATVAATTQDTRQGTTLEPDQQMTEGVDPGVKVARINCPESAHGDWMSVTKKVWKNQNSKPRNPLGNIPKSVRAPSRNQGGKKGFSQQGGAGVSHDVHSGAMQVGAATETAISLNTKVAPSGRKRTRKETTSQGQ